MQFQRSANTEVISTTYTYCRANNETTAEQHIPSDKGGKGYIEFANAPITWKLF